jgi:hypothetical protein
MVWGIIFLILLLISTAAFVTDLNCDTDYAFRLYVLLVSLTLIGWVIWYVK